jgi:hypothetical protein
MEKFMLRVMQGASFIIFGLAARWELGRRWVGRKGKFKGAFWEGTLADLRFIGLVILSFSPMVTIPNME